ncbi:MAG: serine/threonine-protein kinase [Ktedonobacteraceae bacterium]
MIVRTIGQGGMGAVYQAKDMRRNVICAVKEMSLSTVPTNEHGQAVQNFLAEATILSRLNHPNLPAFTDFFTEGARHFLVMEFIDGTTLEDLLEHNGGPFPERRVLGWARQLCDVLEYLHSQQPPVIFRDLKPGNIMLRRDGRIKLIDFGIARLVRRSSSQDTQLLGTPGFAPPEQYGTAQTDERSDMYSLAMTLFQLLTDTLTEKGFGLPDVRSVNPEISLPVAHALEKATSLEPGDRYESIAVFRRALFRVGTFTFQSGKDATTPEELAELCARYPEEAGDYLFAGEIESWFQEIGAADLARVARRIRTTTGEPDVGVEKLVQAIMGPSAHIRSNTAPKEVVSDRAATGAATRPRTSWSGRLSRLRSTPPVVVRPPIIDFGEVYSGLSAPMLLTIAGNQGTSVHGTLRPVEPWIITDQTTFDGMSSLVRVRVDSTRLRGATHYSGTILVIPTGAVKGQPIPVKVEMDVTGYSTTSSGQVGQALDEDEDDVITIAAGMTMAPQQRIQTAAQIPVPYSNPQDKEYKAKYGQPGAWDPLRATPAQRQRMQWSLMFAAAFMAASFFYTLLAHSPFFARAAPLPPNPWFTLVLAAMVPLAALGALLATWVGAWNPKDMLNRASTGLGTALVALGAGEALWHSTISTRLPVLHLCAMLLVTALGATVGTVPYVSAQILRGATWAMLRMRLPVIILAMLLGGALGFALTASVAFGWFTPFGIAVGVSVALALVFRVDRLIHHP